MNKLWKEKKKTISKNFQVSSELLNYIPQDSAEHYKIIPLEFKNGILVVGAVNPKSIDTRDALNFISSRENIDYVLEKISEEDYKRLLGQFGTTGKVLTDALEQIDFDDENVILGISEEEEVSSTSPDDTLSQEAPIIKLVSNMLAQAISKRASDIHVEPKQSFSVIRFRVDGVLEEALQFPRKVHDPLVARVKILSNLRLDERRRPQDGRFSSVINNNRVDFRVATLPTSNGEKIVLRVLDRQQGILSLESLGLTEDTMKIILNAVKRPYGLILAAGPTGAGKTTTLYSLLNILDKKTKNIVSLEDPVEYTIDGVNQSNIRPEIGYSFATGLRSILRGDPDQILVGEIRDKETAQLVVQAALTGHTVFSTIHTNTSIGAVSRLINFGIDPFLLAPTLSAVIGQRMARRIDGESRDIPLSSATKKKFENRFSDLPVKSKKQIPALQSFREVIPTQSNPSGLKGRIGVFEVFDIDEGIKELILNDPRESILKKAARERGMISLEEDAIIKGLQGIIPISEVSKINSEMELGIDLEYEEKTGEEIKYNKEDGAQE